MSHGAALPVEAVLPELLTAVVTRGGAVLEAPTGAGKTTRVPAALLDVVEGEIWVLEPRRVAARAAATHVARLRGGRPGNEVGWVVRHDRRTTEHTRLLYATTGVFLRKLQDDPFLDGVGAVVFDEVHERSLDLELAMALVRRVRAELRESLVVLAMSATLQAAPLASWWGLPVVTSQGRLFPVDIHYLEQPPSRAPYDEAARGIARALATTDGDVLCFLPGLGEIRRTAERLHVDADICWLYGNLPPEKQDAVLSRGKRRKVVLATNVAETSVTIEGITAVVDTGVARVLRHDPGTGLDQLQIEPISQASAEQRAGRAGRLQAGWCLRLWTRAAHQRRPPAETPEVQRVELAQAVLQLWAWGEREVGAFPWYEAPPPAALQRARDLLELLGAIEHDHLTDVGRALATLPLQPRLGRLLMEAHKLGQSELGAWSAALLSERDPFPPHEVRHSSFSDLLDRIDTLMGAGPLAPPPRPVRDSLQRVQRQLVRHLRRLGSPGAPRPPAEALGRSLIAAFPDRVARRRAPRDRRAVTASGLGLELAVSSAVREPEFFVALDGLGGRGADAQVRRAHALDPSWLEPVVCEVQVRWDAELGRVRAVQIERWRALVLRETTTNRPPAAQAGALLASVVAADLSLLPLDEEPLATWRARVRCLADWRVELALPGLDDDALAALAPVLTTDCYALRQLSPSMLLERLAAQLSWRQRDALERLAPERMTVPSGSRLRLHYTPGEPPVLRVRIQELFGWTSTPRVAERVNVRLHLLAPNQRVQQITDDLAGFWTRTYPEIRKELRARYPKHAWPEDPLRATAQRRPRRSR